MKRNKILIIAGGTGGHIFPALAVADILASRGCDIHWLGSKVGLEQELVSPHYPISYISIGRIRGKNLFKKLFSFMQIGIAVLQSCWVILKVRPTMVLAMGGFVSGPGGIAAWLLRKPLVVHEQNSIAGYTNTMLAKFAKKVLCGFPDAFKAKGNGVDADNIGNPVRTSVASVSAPEFRLQSRQGDLRVLILGGSQGASAINHLLLSALNDFSLNKHLDIWHQTGKRDYKLMQAAYKKLPVKVKVNDFIDDIVTAYSWADMVICRSGALTVAELAAVGLASILIPFPYAVDNHQYHNAQLLEAAGAAYVFPQNDITPKKLCDLLGLFINQRDHCQQMALKARAIARPNAVHDASDACLRVMEN